MALYAVSDIHGCYDHLERVLQEVDYSPSRDQLFILGDMLDRGRDSRKTVEFCIDLQAKGAKVLRGNHEEMVISCFDTSSKKIISLWEWLEFCGGADTVESYIENGSISPVLGNHVEWFKSLPLYEQHGAYTLVHAAVRPGVPLAWQSPDDMLWGVNEFISDWKGPEYIIAGHTPVQVVEKGRTTPLVNPKVALIDTGSPFSGILTLAKLPPDPSKISELEICQVYGEGKSLQAKVSKLIRK